MDEYGLKSTVTVPIRYRAALIMRTSVHVRADCRGCWMSRSVQAMASCVPAQLPALVEAPVAVASFGTLLQRGDVGCDAASAISGKRPLTNRGTRTHNGTRALEREIADGNPP